MAAKVAYIVVNGLVGLAVLGGGAWLTYDSGNGAWIVGAIIWSLLISYGFTKRVNSWGDMGHIE